MCIDRGMKGVTEARPMLKHDVEVFLTRSASERRTRTSGIRHLARLFGCPRQSDE